jgi:hypothetical protein
MKDTDEMINQMNLEVKRTLRMIRIVLLFPEEGKTRIFLKKLKKT